MERPPAKPRTTKSITAAIAPAGPPPVLRLSGVSFVRNGRVIVAPIDWDVESSQRWLILGANGSGKTSLVRICAMYEHPSSGEISVLGETLGRTDVRVLRRRIGYASAAMAAQIRTDLSCLDVVMTAKYAALEPWWHRYDDDDRAQALKCLERMGVGAFATRAVGTLSSGEQQRVYLARTLMNDPGILFLDEPSARLDLAGREDLVGAMTELTTDQRQPPLVLITHHLDEVPPGITDVMMLRRGEVVARGPIDQTLTAEHISECFEMNLNLERRDDGRWSAWAKRSMPTAQSAVPTA